MRKAEPDAAFGSWASAGIPLTIEYSLDLMEEIRAAAHHGRGQSSRGGLEIGGVLFGSRIEKTIRIVAWRPIARDYARAPAFLLSPNDRIELGKLLRSAASDPDLTGLYPLGWFVSHSRPAIEMTTSDRRIYQQFFPSDCQTTLVIHPEPDGSARAGFFLRDASGDIPVASPLEFVIEPDEEAAEPEAESESVEEQPAREERPRLEERYLDRPRQPIPSEEELFDEDSDPRRVPIRRRLRDYRGWIWMVPVLLALLVAIMILPRSTTPKRTPSFSLRASEVGGELRLEWDRNADVIKDAARGTLDVKDGPIFVPISLDADRLHDGYFSYTRLSGDLELRMTVYPTKGPPVSEIAKFVGPPATPHAPAVVSATAATAATPPLPAAEQTGEANRERDKLKEEVEQLRDNLRKETARRHQLEETVRILEQRVQVQKLLEPKQ